MKLVALNEQHHKGQQSLEFTGLYGITETSVKLRVKIKRDSFEFQSYAIIEAYDIGAMRWNFLAEIPYSQMATLADSYYGNGGLAHLQSDIDNLLEQARLILGL